MTQDTFDQLWRESLTRQKQIFNSVLTQCKLFSNLS